MSVLSANSIRKIQPVTPFVERGVFNGLSYGLSLASYDIRIDQDIFMKPNSFCLNSSMERFKMPKNVIAEVKDKSSLARQGIHVLNTVIEPGWEGYLTLELNMANVQYRTPDVRFAGIQLFKGQPIAAVMFYWVDEETPGYQGKYQNQEAGPQGARFELTKSTNRQTEFDFEQED